MSEEVRASVRRSWEGAVRLVEEHAQGGRTRTAFWWRQLEEENRKLKQLVAEQALDIVVLKAVL
jgi:hypothetical protein